MRALLSSLLLVLVAGCGEPRSVPRDDAGIDPPDPTVDSSVPQTDRDAGSTTMMMADAAVRPTSPLVDPACTDGTYSETLPNPSADISDLVASYNSSAVEQFVRAVLARRYGVGLELVNGGDLDRDCILAFLDDTSTASNVIRGIATVVHECGHMYDHSLAPPGSDTYVINDSLQFTAADGDTTTRGGVTFARSRIVGDPYTSLRAPCNGQWAQSCDYYADIYLDGNPDDTAFDSGDQGFNSVLEETVQYVNSLATAYAFHPELASGFSVSERDGILTFLWYVMRYLRLARLSYPSAYSHILNGDGGRWREAILTVWGRAWLYLDATRDIAHLGLSDDAVMQLVMNADLLDEIGRLREASGCAP